MLKLTLNIESNARIIVLFLSIIINVFLFIIQAFSNWEDTAMAKNDPEERKKMLQTNPDVERVRR